MRELRSFQAHGIERLRQLIGQGHKRVMFQAPTGVGKTLTAASIVQSALEKKKRTIFTVPALSLVDQTVREFAREGITDVGVIQANHIMTDYAKPVQVASIQTLARRQIPDADLVIIDEAHRLSTIYPRWMGDEAWAHVPFIGLSATPWTRGLGRLYDRLVVAITIRQAIEQGLLSPFRVFAPSHPDLSKVRSVAGDYHEGDLANVMNKGTLVADIVETWLEKGKGRPTLCFAVDRAHAKSIHDRFEEAGVASAYMDANTDVHERERIRRDFHSGRIEIVVNIGVLIMGVDWDVRCIIFARPTKSDILYVQAIGRGLRPALGKSELLVLDHSDTTLRLGFVTDIHHANLSQGRLGDRDQADAEARAPAPLECPKCAFLRSSRTLACPNCGYVGRTKVNGVETVKGELVELGAHKATKAAEKRNKDEEWPKKVAFIRQLRAYAIKTGRREAWVAHRYRAFYGCWPNDPRVRYAKPAPECGPQVRAWIQAQNIRFAKSKAANG